MSNSLRPHELQHARPPCPSPTPGVYPNPCPPSQWCHPTISSSVVPFSSYPQSLPALGSFPMSQFFTWGGQSIGASASTTPSNEHPGLTFFRMDRLDTLAVQGTLKGLCLGTHKDSDFSLPSRELWLSMRALWKCGWPWSQMPSSSPLAPNFWLRGPGQVT